MKIIFCLLLFATLIAAVEYGDGAKKSDIISMKTILTNPKKYIGKKVTVQGIVLDVCAKRGCWMSIKDNSAQNKIRVKVQDGVMVFPLTSKGKITRAQGILRAFELSKEETIDYHKHIALENGKKFDPKSIKGPMTLYQLDALGAVIE